MKISRALIAASSLVGVVAIGSPAYADQNATQQRAAQLLDEARQRLLAGDSQTASTLAFQAAELLATGERNGYHVKLTRARELQTRR